MMARLREAKTGETGQTFYTRHGDWFPVLCALLAAGCLAAGKLARG
jgi:apolipoprotein N-acyltransferase